MNKEEIKKRLNQAYDYLYDIGKVHSVKDLADKMRRSRPGVSRALNGDEAYLNEKFTKSFADTFDMISYDWLVYGTGAMLNDGEPQQQEPHMDHSSLVNALVAAKDETIESLKRELASKDDLVAAMQSELTAKNDHIATLKERLQEYRRIIDSHTTGYPYPIGAAEPNKPTAK